MSGWISAVLGTVLVRITVGGAVLTGLKFVWDGFYVVAAFILVPIVLFLLWDAYETLYARDPLLDEPR